MPSQTRDQIIEAADRLFYERGFEATSFADIAEEIEISRGNFYYHFKTKDEILDAVIDQRLAERCRLLKQWQDEADGPRTALAAFIDILVKNQAKIMLYGCPVGTLCNELARLNHPAQPEAIGLFTLFRGWLSDQFSRLTPEADADALALHLLARSQGIAALANAYRDEDFIDREVEELHGWLDAMCADSSRFNPSGHT